jgi:hypothetical protein
MSMEESGNRSNWGMDVLFRSNPIIEKPGSFSIKPLGPTIHFSANASAPHIGRLVCANFGGLPYRSAVSYAAHSYIVRQDGSRGRKSLLVATAIPWMHQLLDGWELCFTDKHECYLHQVSMDIYTEWKLNEVCGDDGLCSH